MTLQMKIGLAVLALLTVLAGTWVFMNTAYAPHTPEIMPARSDAPLTGDATNLAALSTSSAVQLKTEMVEYYPGVKGYFARPAAEGQYPGVVMVHEWWGLNDNIKKMAEELAKEGYAVLAVDMFGRVATTADEARAQVGSLDQAKAKENLRAATGYLRTQKASKIASLGWCFGGGQSLQLALSGEQLDATVIYYGNLVTDKQKLMSLSWPILGIFGDKDTSIPVETVKEFKEGLDGLMIQNDITIYPGVGHAFANPSGQNYAPAETKDAWAKTLKFLAENLK